VVITGLGIISCLGNSYQEVVESLNKGASGIRQVPEWEELGLRSTIAGKARHTEEKRRSAGLSKKHVNCMSDAALYCTLAAKDAIEDAALTREDLGNGRVGCIVGFTATRRIGLALTVFSVPCQIPVAPIFQPFSGLGAGAIQSVRRAPRPFTILAMHLS
jgi:hypothetical protein